METLTLPKDIIAERAYEIYKSRGGKPGSDLDDWLRAEKELARSSMPGAHVPFETKNNKNVSNGRKHIN